jgi:hypothetical protein
MISYNGAVITDLKEDKSHFDKRYKDKSIELYDCSLKVRHTLLPLMENCK